MTTLACEVSGLLDARPTEEIPWRGGPGRLLDDLEAAGLTGRGGAGFPAWRKASAALGGAAPVVVANAAEGEPLSHKDAELLRRNPHEVLDGLQLAAEAVGATRAYLYVSRAAHDPAVTALAARRQRDRLPVTVVVAADGFLAGEESAVIAAVEGRRPLPRFRTIPVPMSGVDGRPTLVHNVETLAHIARIARYGPDWFRGTGTEGEPGTLLTTITGPVRTPGVHEVPLGLPIGDVLTRAGGPTARLQAVLVGGFHGVWVPWPAARTVPLSRDGLIPHDGSPGAGILHPLAVDECGLRFAADVLDYLSQQSAKQCGPCLNGLPAIAAAITALAAGKPDPQLPQRLAWLAGLVERRGACHHPDGSARFLRSTLRVFSVEVTAHLAGRCTHRSRS